MSTVPTNQRRDRQLARAALARHSGEGRNPPTSSFRTPHGGDPESSFSVPLEAVAFASLGEVADINPRFDRDELTDDMLVSFVPMKCVEEESGQFVPLEDRRVGDVRKGYTAFRDGDVIFAKVTPCMENGKAAVVSGLTNNIGFGSTEFFVLRPSERIDPKYLLHFVLQQSFRKEAARNMTGAVGLRRVPKSWLEQQQTPLPSIAAQRQIVAELEKQFTRLDAGVAALRRVQANLKRYRAAILKAACEGRLVPTEAELAKAAGRTYEAAEQLLARILAERRKNWRGRGKYKEPALPETTDLPLLPEGWTWATMPQLGELGRGKSKHRPRDDIKLYGGPYPFIQTGDVRKSRGTIRDYAQTYSELGLQQSQLWPAGTLCITIAANIAETGILNFDACFPDSVVGFVQNVGPSTTRYLEFFVRTARERLEQFAPATAQKNINLDVLQKVAIPLPPLAEQARIVSEVERRLSIIEELEAAVAANLQRATRLRQSVLQRVFVSRTVV